MYKAKNPVQQRRQFEILETIGRGAFGTVYRARLKDAGGFSKQVALKVMHYTGDSADEIAARLRDEARILGLIRHRAIVGVNSLVTLESGWAVVMEYIDGVDLTSLITTARPSLRVTCEIIEEVASALDAAWTTVPHGSSLPLHLVHRDIKPRNIRVTRHGEVKLLDFGVARAEFGQKETDEATGAILGSLRYMAPERRAGDETPGGDIYALGIVFANLLTGRRFAEPPADEVDHSRFVGTILEIVRSSVEVSTVNNEQDPVYAVTLLLLSMLAYEHSDRPIARDVEHRLRKIRSVLSGTGLRDFADTIVPRTQARHALRQAEDQDPRIGRTLEELVPLESPHGPRPADFETSSPPAPRPAEVLPPEEPPPKLRLPILLGAVLLVGLSTLASWWAFRDSPDRPPDQAIVTCTPSGPEILDGIDNDCDGHVDLEGPWEGEVRLQIQGRKGELDVMAFENCHAAFDLSAQEPLGEQGLAVFGSLACPLEDAVLQETMGAALLGRVAGSAWTDEGAGSVSWQWAGEVGGHGDARWTVQPTSFNVEVGADLMLNGSTLTLSGAGALSRPSSL